MDYEYLFFDRGLAEHFARGCDSVGAATQVAEQPDGVVVRLTKAVDDAVVEQIEALYDELFFGEQAEMVEAEEEGVAMTGMQIQLKDGGYTTVLLPPEIMNRLLSVFTIDELNQFMHDVARAIEDPNGGGTVCEVMRRKGNDAS